MSQLRQFPRIPLAEPRHLILGLVLFLGMFAVPGCSTLTLHGSAITAPFTAPDTADASAPQVQGSPLREPIALSSEVALLTSIPTPGAVALGPLNVAGSPTTSSAPLETAGSWLLGPTGLSGTLSGTSSGTVMVSGLTTDLLRVRGGPGTDYLILGKLAPDTSVVAIGRSADAAWLLITDPQHGWVSASYVILDHPASALPIRLPANVVPATPTLTATPTPTGAIAGGPVTGLDFHAEPGALFYAGQCVDLFWNVDGVREVYISGQATVGHGRQRVCPKQTTAYQLRVISNDGTAQDAWVSVTAQFNYCPVQVQTQVVIQTPTPGPTQTPWVVVVTATPTPTPTATPTAMPTRTRTATATASKP